VDQCWARSLDEDCASELASHINEAGQHQPDRYEEVHSIPGLAQDEMCEQPDNAQGRDNVDRPVVGDGPENLPTPSPGERVVEGPEDILVECEPQRAGRFKKPAHQQGNAEAAAQEKSCGMPVFGSVGDHAASSCKML
jgi:hypothetical protein